ncbi:MAG: GNAT family N-acetyltransferase [Dysgonamonadaceae bacterium]|jgi:RimJ/RimL family protein N-acetyltransferase|nr:GNAT family N-acetyltransferase [Dysgonamonadaceae bacterium]
MITTNFTLREWQPSDATSLAENANNINVWNNVRDYFPHPYCEKDGDTFILAVLRGEMGIQRAIVVDNKAVGGIGAFPKTDVERITAEIGYWLGEEYWNKGIVTQAVREFTEYIFLNLPEILKICAPVFDFNLASQRVLQKAGFESEAILKQAAIKNGKIIDLYYYSLLKSQWKRKIYHRFYSENDFPLLENLLYEAIFQPEGTEPLPRNIIKKPEIDVYIRDFGKKKDDLCMFAELNGKTVGGAWLRILDGNPKGYGNIDHDTPELAIAVFKPYQNIGIGTSLMYNIIDLTFHSRGYKQISLSVDKANYAVKMYKKFGFEIISENEHDYIMVLKKLSAETALKKYVSANNF